MEEKIPDIDILGANFRKMDEKMSFMKEQLSKFEKNEKLNINLINVMWPYAQMEDI